MADKDTREQRNRDFVNEIDCKERRKLAARKDRNYSMWSDLGTFGVVGWAVAVPVLVFTAIGVWLDERYQSDVSWTLTLIFAGIVLGCVNAWIWVTRERKSLGDSDRNSQDVSNEEKE